MENPTTIHDIFEASGGIESDYNPHPFKIELLVVPTAIEMGADGEFVTLGVILHDDFKPNSRGMQVIHHEAEVQLPVSQVKIIKD